jgi:Fur family transcriptional regulator, iron response regulator
MSELGTCQPRDADKIQVVLRQAGLRPTRQRLALATMLFAGEDRHVTAEALFDEARGSGIGISLATVYNTLHQFTEAGLLRSIAVDTARTYFDTNTGNHHHFFLEDRNEVVDVPEGHVHVDGLPEPPPGMEIVRVDVVIRLRKRQD